MRAWVTAFSGGFQSLVLLESVQMAAVDAGTLAHMNPIPSWRPTSDLCLSTQNARILAAPEHAIPRQPPLFQEASGRPPARGSRSHPQPGFMDTPSDYLKVQGT